VTVGRGVFAELRGRGDTPVNLQGQGSVVDLGWHEAAPLLPREPREPGTGANAGRFPQTARDAFRALSQVRGSPADSLRSGQTGRSWLGVKGSRVQIPPSRLFFERFFATYSSSTAVPEEDSYAAGGFKITTLGLGGFASRVLRVVAMSAGRH